MATSITVHLIHIAHLIMYVNIVNIEFSVVDAREASTVRPEN